MNLIGGRGTGHAFREGRDARKSTTPGVEKRMLIFEKVRMRRKKGVGYCASTLLGTRVRVGWLLFAPEADDVAVRVAYGAPVAHSAADRLPFLQDSSAEALRFLLRCWYGVYVDVEC